MGKNLKYAIGLVLIIFIGSLALLNLKTGGTKQNVLPQKQEQSNSIETSLKVNENVYRVSVSTGSSVYDLMQEAVKTTEFRFGGKIFRGLGFFVNEINGIKQDGKKGEYWIYYINDKEAQVGVSAYILKPNDVITWKYEKSNN